MVKESLEHALWRGRNNAVKAMARLRKKAEEEGPLSTADKNRYNLHHARFKNYLRILRDKGFLN